MDENTKEELVERFRAYLDTDFVPEPPEDYIDQMTLFNELAGLKNEVRIESRQLKGALDDFRQAFTSLDYANQDVSKMLLHIQQQDKDLAHIILKPVVLGMIDLYDRIAAGLAQQPPGNSFLDGLLPGRQQSRKWLQGHLEGQQMVLGRLLELLGQCGVFAMETNGEKFDANLMQAVGFESDPRQENGMVLHEHRKGFRQGNRSIRPAEVIVNKREKR